MTARQNIPHGPELPADCQLGDIFVLTEKDPGLWICSFQNGIMTRADRDGPTLYCHADDDPIKDYKQISNAITPSQPEQYLAADVVSGGGPVQLGSGGTAKSFVTQNNFPAAVLIAAGVWNFSVYAFVNSVTDGTSVVRIFVHKRASDGAETLLFGPLPTPPLLLQSSLIRVATVQPEIVLSPADRLVVKFYGFTQAATGKTVTMAYAGANHCSRLTIPPLGI